MGLTQGDLAKRMTALGETITRQTINGIERTGRADQASVEKFSRFFGVSVATMYETDTETANMQFLAAVIDRLSDREFDRLAHFSRALMNITAVDKIRPKGR